jgi:phage head maturation protease
MNLIERAFALDDIAIRAGGSGRTVLAYCAVFDSPYEVRDYQGHYFEQIHRSAFNRVEKDALAGRMPMCLYNHGFILNTSTPSEKFSTPLGKVESIRADQRGLLTVTEYAKTPLADEVLELIRAEAITTQSFRGAIHQSRPRPMREGIRSVELMQLGLSDFGPTPAAVAREATIVGVRSQVILDQFRDLSEEERAELLAQLSDASMEPTTEVVPPGSPPAADAPPAPVAPTPPVGPSLETLEAEQAQRLRRYDTP